MILDNILVSFVFLCSILFVWGILFLIANFFKPEPQLLAIHETREKVLEVHIKEEHISPGLYYGDYPPPEPPPTWEQHIITEGESGHRHERVSRGLKSDQPSLSFGDVITFTENEYAPISHRFIVFRRLFIAIGILLYIGASCLIFLVGPRVTMKTYCDALLRGDYPTAYSLLSNREKAFITENDLANTWGTPRPLEAVGAPFTTQPNTNQAHVSGCRVEANLVPDGTIDLMLPDGSKDSFVATLTIEDFRWKIEQHCPNMSSC